MKKLIQKAVVWGLAASCAALDHIPRFGRTYEVHPTFGLDGEPHYEDFIRPTGRWKFFRQGQWGCSLFGGRFALWSARLDEKWDTGVWESS
jgi:hypothetical protein